MALLNDDLFVVQRGDQSYKLTAGTLRLNVGSVIVDSNPPSSAAQGDLWWDTVTANLYMYYNDGDSQQWVDASPGVDATTFAALAGRVSTLENIISTLQTRLAAIEADHTTMMSSTDTNNGY